MPTNMRRYERVPFLTQVEIKDLSTGTGLPGRSIDLSRGGIGFFCRRFIPPGTPILIQINMHKGRIKLTACARAVVVQAKFEDSGAVMGAAFEPVLHPAVQPLLCDYLDRHY